jgi:hypothetical protein
MNLGFLRFLRKDGFFDNLVGRYIVETLNRCIGRKDCASQVPGGC